MFYWGDLGPTGQFGGRPQARARLSRGTIRQSSVDEPVRPKSPSYRAARNVGGHLCRTVLELTFAGLLLDWKTRRREVGPSFDLRWKRTFLRAARRLGLSFPEIPSRSIMSTFPARDLQVVAQPCARCLFNHRDEELSRIRLAELVVSSGGPQGPVVFEAPVYKTGGLPSHSYTELPPPS